MRKRSLLIAFLATIVTAAYLVSRPRERLLVSPGVKIENLQRRYQKLSFENKRLRGELEKYSTQRPLIDQVIELTEKVGRCEQKLSTLSMQYEEAAEWIRKNIRVGVNYCDWQGRYGSRESKEVIKRIADIGIKRIIFTPTYWQKERHDSVIYSDRKYKEGKSPRLEQLIADIEFAHQSGLDVGIKMHIDLEEEEEHYGRVIPVERSKINPEDFEEWMKNYRGKLMDMVKVAVKCNVKDFYVGCELDTVVSKHPDSWKKLIADVREEFRNNGKDPRIIYACEHDFAFQILIWDDVDIIGVNTWPYFSEIKELSIEAAKQAWGSVRYIVKGSTMGFFEYLNLLHVTYGKPIILTEIGIQSRQGDLQKPGEWWPPNEKEVIADPIIQILFYEGFYRALKEHFEQFRKNNPGKVYFIKGVDVWNATIDPGLSDYNIRGKPTVRLFQNRFLGLNED